MSSNASVCKIWKGNHCEKPEKNAHYDIAVLCLHLFHRHLNTPCVLVLIKHSAFPPASVLISLDVSVAWSPCKLVLLSLCASKRPASLCPWRCALVSLSPLALLFHCSLGAPDPPVVQCPWSPYPIVAMCPVWQSCCSAPLEPLTLPDAVCLKAPDPRVVLFS